MFCLHLFWCHHLSFFNTAHRNARFLLWWLALPRPHPLALQAGDYLKAALRGGYTWQKGGWKDGDMLPTEVGVGATRGCVGVCVGA